MPPLCFHPSATSQFENMDEFMLQRNASYTALHCIGRLLSQPWSCKTQEMTQLETRLIAITLGEHSRGHLPESCNIAAGNQRRELSLRRRDIFLCRLEAHLEAIRHDTLQLFVDFFGSPLHPRGVLRHLKAGDGHAPCVCRFACCCILISKGKSKWHRVDATYLERTR